MSVRVCGVWRMWLGFIIVLNYSHLSKDQLQPTAISLSDPV